MSVYLNRQCLCFIYLYIYIYIYIYIFVNCNWVVTRWQYCHPVAVHKVSVILQDNVQRASHKRYGPPTSVAWLQLLNKAHSYLHLHRSHCSNTLIYAKMISRTFLDLWYQFRLVNVTCFWSWRLCGINLALHANGTVLYPSTPESSS